MAGEAIVADAFLDPAALAVDLRAADRLFVPRLEAEAFAPDDAARLATDRLRTAEVRAADFLRAVPAAFAFAAEDEAGRVARFAAPPLAVLLVFVRFATPFIRCTNDPQKR